MGESAIFFTISVLTCFGIAVWVIYGAFGLGALPMFLIKGTKSLQETKNELSNDLSKIRERYRAIQEKYARSHTKISKSDQRLLSNLKKQERFLVDFQGNFSIKAGIFFKKGLFQRKTRKLTYSRINSRVCRRFSKY